MLYLGRYSIWEELFFGEFNNGNKFPEELNMYKPVIDELYKVLKNKLIVQYGEAPSKEEMAKKLGVSIEVIDRCELLLDDIASLNVMVGDGNYTELWETLPSDVKTPEEAMLSIDLR